MFEFLINLKKSVILYSVLSVLFGCILVLFPHWTSRTICEIFALMIFICGVKNLINYFSSDQHSCFQYELISGFILCCVAIFVFLHSDTVIIIIPLIAGIFMLCEGIIYMKKAWQLKDFSYDHWYYEMIMSIVLFILGIVLIVNPFHAAILSIRLIGICLIYDGILNVCIMKKFEQFHM